jgi:hypothetical protein
MRGVYEGYHGNPEASMAAIRLVNSRFLDLATQRVKRVLYR